MRVLIALGTLPYLLLVPIWGTLFPIYAKDVFNAGPTGLGVLLTAVGVGGIAGSFLANALARMPRQALMKRAALPLMAIVLASAACGSDKAARHGKGAPTVVEQTGYEAHT